MTEIGLGGRLHTAQSDTAPSGHRRSDGMRLRFRDGELENQFILSYRASARPWIRVSLVVALSTVLGFAIIDHALLVGPRFVQPDIWRFGLQLPLVLIMLVLTTPRLYVRSYQPAIQVGSTAVRCRHRADGDRGDARTAAAGRRATAARDLLLLLHDRTHLRRGVRTNLILIGVYAGAALWARSRPTVAVYSLFVLFCANLIGGSGCYALEYANRVAFLERRRLSEVALHDGLTGLLTAPRWKSRRALCGGTRRSRACRSRCC